MRAGDLIPRVRRMLGMPCCRYKRPTTVIFSARAGVRHLLTEDLQDYFALQRVTFINPFKREHDQLID